jgi:hypothetical protein
MTWFLTHRVPAIAREWYEVIMGIPKWKRKSYNVKVYDGLTRNDFQVGAFLVFLYKINIIKRPVWTDDDGRGYFIGYEDDI